MARGRVTSLRYLRCWLVAPFGAAFRPSRVECTPQKGLAGGRLMDEPVTERQVAAQAAATDEKTFNLSISDRPPELGKILLFEVAALAMS